MDVLEQTFKKVSGDLVEKIKAEPGGEAISRCYQCGTCTASCIVHTYRKDFNPRLIIRKAVLGVEDVMDSIEPWYCAVCYMCTERCPRDVEPSTILMAIKNVASKEGRVPAGFKNINENVVRIGRLFEFDDFTNFMREDLGLPPMDPLDEEEMGKLISGTRFEKVMKEEKNE